MAFGRWTDSSTFEDSTFRFQDTPALDTPFAPETQDVYRWGVGAEYRVHPAVPLRTGVARGQNALEPRSVTPLLSDYNDLISGGGGGVDLGRWTIDLAGGMGFFDDRKINAGEARAFPGASDQRPRRLLAADAPVLRLKQEDRRQAEEEPQPTSASSTRARRDHGPAVKKAMPRTS